MAGGMWHVWRGEEVSERKPDRKRLLEKPWRRWKGNIKMDLQEVGWKGVAWVQDRGKWWAFAKMVMNLRVP